MSTMQTPPMDFIRSRTHRNLVSACQGEGQARRQYLTAADALEEADLYVAAHALRFTAAQEKEHAAIFRGLLRVHGSVAPDEPEADPPLLPGSPVEMLRHIALSEHGEWDRLYPAFADLADQEGYPRIATAFRRIAETEHLHARRFLQYADALDTGTLFEDPNRLGWLCLRCGHLHYGRRAPDTCSTCGRSRGHFIRSSFEPFTVTP